MRVEFQVTESGGGGSVTNAVIERLRAGREKIAAGWARNLSETSSGTRIFHCLTGALYHVDSGRDHLLFGRALAALNVAIPAGFTCAHQNAVTGLAPDDVGETTGWGRTDQNDSCRVASFNNMAPNKQVVLDLMDRAIAMEMQKAVALAA